MKKIIRIKKVKNKSVVYTNIDLVSKNDLSGRLGEELLSLLDSIENTNPLHYRTKGVS